MGKDWDNFSDSKRKDTTAERARANADKEKLRQYQQGATPFGYSHGTGKTTKQEREAFISFMTDVMAECLRVLKPGGFGFVWSLPRTSHWTALALEDAGFTIREKCYHLFGSGFPKSKNLSNGVGSALKPAVEEWILCRKPLSESSLEANYAKWGTGGLAIDACRISTQDNLNGGAYSQSPREDGKATNKVYGEYYRMPNEYQQPQGRFPSNLLLSHSWLCTDDLCDEQCPIRLLDEQSGIRKSGLMKPGQQRNASLGKGGYHGDFPDIATQQGTYGDQGGASRYFTQFCYTAKASRAERNRGCEGLPEGYNDWQRETSGLNQDRPNREGRKPMGPQSNHHPTVKPLALMSWLCRLITPPGGTVLDCFVGSGSTLCAAIYEGFHFIGIEQEASYVEIARARVRHAWEVQP